MFDYPRCVVYVTTNSSTPQKKPPPRNRLLPEKGEQFLVCRLHYVLGEIYRSKGEIEKAVHHFEIALEIASSFNWQGLPFWVHSFPGAAVSSSERKIDDANAHVERAKCTRSRSKYDLGHAMELQAVVWYRQGRLKEARSEALGAIDIFEKLGAVRDQERCSGLLRWIEEEMNDPVALYFDGELLETTLLPTPINSPMASRGTEGIGWHRLAYLSRCTLLFRRILRETVVQCGLGRLRADVYLLVTGSSLLVPLILPSQYAPPDQLNSCTCASFCFWFSHVIDLSPV
jgi:hypothetical protein